ncbi:MAG TPA: tyrosine recombinase [bacterium]|nr:tyrosine recombinase [bacterium]HOL47047.1 tyrosine recombinase [bacterium]HPQ17948.1 tyrosine recombinase [bacterium]
MNIKEYYYFEQFNRYLKIEKNASEHTILNYNLDLTEFWNFLEANYNIKKTDEINYKMIRNYLGELKSQNKKSSTISRKLSTIKSYMKFLLREGIIKINEADKITYPKRDKNLPKFLFIKEIEQILNSIEQDSYLNIRNKFLLELLYSTGMRISECLRINIQDILLDNNSIKILGKGNRERYVFFGKIVKELFPIYLEYRKLFLDKIGKVDDDGALFLNHLGERLTARGVRFLINKIVKNAAIQKKISPHTFRHTFATHLLNNGANIRIVQELLGHRSLSSTQIYTHISKEKLIEMYNKFHKR